MQIAILTLDGFNELDSFIAAGILNRMKPQGWAAHITPARPPRPRWRSSARSR